MMRVFFFKWQLISVQPDSLHKEHCLPDSIDSNPLCFQTFLCFHGSLFGSSVDLVLQLITFLYFKSLISPPAILMGLWVYCEKWAASYFASDVMHCQWKVKNPRLNDIVMLNCLNSLYYCDIKLFLLYIYVMCICCVYPNLYLIECWNAFSTVSIIYINTFF